MTGTLFVFGKDEVEMLRVVDGIEHGKNRSARVTDYEMLATERPSTWHVMFLTDVLYTLPQHHLVKDLSSSLANEPESKVHRD
jgi:hypothetical protein